MIAYLKGKILQKTLNYIILLVSSSSESNESTISGNDFDSGSGSVGYKVFTTPEILELPLGSQIELYIYHKSGDDGQTLLGMPNFAELQFFEMLITVTGVGPKMALTIVSAAKIDILQQAIANEDTEIFTRMSGVGKKTAERIILELKNKITSNGVLGEISVSGSEIYDALSGLGYNPREIREAIPQLDSSADTATQLKQALKILSRN